MSEIKTFETADQRLCKMRQEKELEAGILKKVIRIQERQVEEAQAELKKLQEELEAAQTSEMPILLFLIDHTMPMPDSVRDYEYRGYYYLPEFNRIDERWYRGCWQEDIEFLPGTLDWRERFKDLRVPEKMWPGDLRDYCAERYPNPLTVAANRVRGEIFQILATSQVKTWKGLAQKLRARPVVPEN